MDMDEVTKMLNSTARARGVSAEALKGFIAGITFMTYGMSTPEDEWQITEAQWLEQCLDLIIAVPGSPYDQ